MTTDEPALLAAIADNPDDDLPRLVYADWLEENTKPCDWCDGTGEERVADAAGDMDDVTCRRCHGSKSDGRKERAEFIRVQVTLASIGEIEKPDCNRYYDQKGCDCRECRRYRTERPKQINIERRERELWFRQEIHGWTCHEKVGEVEMWWPDSGGPKTVGTVRRGFVAEIRLPLAAFLTHAADLFRQQPITTVTLSDREPFPSESKWSWWNGDRYASGGSHPQSDLPADLFSRLAGETYDDTRHKTYATREFALTALSAACCLYGRSITPHTPTA